MRATYLQYRNPKESTPSAYYPLNTNQGKPLNRFEYLSQSESRRGTFSQGHRFLQGSIYHNVGARTSEVVGPGAYREEDAVLNLKKKPCMSTFFRPMIGPTEDAFDMQGHVRVL